MIGPVAAFDVVPVPVLVSFPQAASRPVGTGRRGQPGHCLQGRTSAEAGKTWIVLNGQTSVASWTRGR